MPEALLLPRATHLIHAQIEGGTVTGWHRPGPGQTIVFLHGNTSSKEAFRPIVESVALDGFNILALDFLGAGEAENTNDVRRDYTIPGLACCVMEVLAALGISNPVLVGWSLGGHIAIEAVAQGLNVIGLVLTGTPPCGPGMADVMETFRFNELFAVGSSENPADDMLDRYIGCVFGRAVSDLPALIVADARRFDGRLRANFGEHWLSGTQGHNQREFIANWKGPICVIQGSGEVFFDPTLIDRLAWANLWRGKSQMIDNAGHAPFFEQPETYGQILREFISQLDA
jgi:pimeloyl-ACP methyl ester carboxylesterase